MQRNQQPWQFFPNRAVRGHQEVNLVLAPFAAGKTLKAIQRCGCQPGKCPTRSGPQDGYPKPLPLRKRSGVGHDDATARPLPPPAGHAPAEFLWGHPCKRGRNVHNSVLLAKQIGQFRWTAGEMRHAPTVPLPPACR